MSNTNILQLPVATGLDGSEYFPIVQGSTTRRCAIGLMETFTTTAGLQAANIVYAGPVSGGTAAPAFRALVAADIPFTPSGAAWTSWTPTVSSAGGTVTGATITTTAKYKALGKTVWWQITCTLTNIGSGSPTGAVLFTTPVGYTPLNVYGVASCYYVNIGAAGAGFIGSGGLAYAFKSDGSTFWANGNVFAVGGTYESA